LVVLNKFPEALPIIALPLTALVELAILEARTLKAPEGGHDDLAMALINGLAGLWWKSWEEAAGEGESVVVEYPDIFEGLEM
jgi:hypothetical protein